MEDDDDVAVTDGMEPESPTGEAPSGDDDDDDGDDVVAAGGPIAALIDAPRGTRQISDKTRELAKKIAEAHKGKTAKGEHDLPSDDDTDVEYDEQPNGAQAAPAAETARPASTPVELPAPSQPPAASLDPEVTRLRDDFTRRMAELDAREGTLSERERSSDIATLADQYFERGAPAIVEVLKRWEGVEGEDLKDVIADLVSDLTIHMGVDVPQEVKDRLEAKRTRKQVRRMRDEQGRLEQDRVKAQTAAQEEQNRVRVKGILTQEIAKPEHAQSYQWLIVEPNAGEIILDVVDGAHKKDGTRITWQEAAKRANDYLKQQSRAWYDTRRHLLATASKEGDASSGKQQRPQGDPQVRRSQAPPVTPPPTPPSAPSDGKWDPEAHRKAVKAKFRAAFRQTEE